MIYRRQKTTVGYDEARSNDVAAITSRLMDDHDNDAQVELDLLLQLHNDGISNHILIK